VLKLILQFKRTDILIQKLSTINGIRRLGVIRDTIQSW